MTAVIALPLFVPADRSDRFAKAAASGSDAVILDLEDAVAPEAKISARDRLVRGFAEAAGVPRLVRVNAAGTPWYEDDLAAIRVLPVDGVVLPKAEDPETVRRVGAAIGGTHKVIALVESAAGLAAASTLAEHCGRLAFGSIDFAPMSVARMSVTRFSSRDRLSFWRLAPAGCRRRPTVSPPGSMSLPSSRMMPPMPHGLVSAASC